MIVITDGDCTALGKGWKRYRELNGRFPAAAQWGPPTPKQPVEADKRYKPGEDSDKTPSARFVAFCHYKPQPSKCYDHLIEQVYESRNRPLPTPDPGHTVRWDRALLAFGERISGGTTLKPLTASEARGFANRGDAWYRWKPVAEALEEIEAAQGQ